MRKRYSARSYSQDTTAIAKPIRPPRKHPSRRDDTHENLRISLGSCNAPAQLSRSNQPRCTGPMQPGKPLDAIPGNAASALRRAVARRHPGAAKGRRRTQRGSPWVPNARRPARGRFPLRALSAQKEKRPPRARRPALPQPCAAVLSAKAGLTAGFGMGPGDPRLCGRARGGRSPAALLYSSLPGTPSPGRPWRPHGGHGRR